MKTVLIKIIQCFISHWPWGNQSGFSSIGKMHYHHSVLSIRWALYFTLLGNRLQERCSVYQELLRYHTMPTECCEASVCVLFVSLCVVPIAIWSHNVPLCSRISPFLKSQAPLLSSSGFRWLPLLWHWTVSWKYGCQQELFKFSKTQLLLKMQYIITSMYRMNTWQMEIITFWCESVMPLWG